MLNLSIICLGHYSEQWIKKRITTESNGRGFNTVQFFIGHFIANENCVSYMAPNERITLTGELIHL